MKPTFSTEAAAIVISGLLLTSIPGMAAPGPGGPFLGIVGSSEFAELLCQLR